MTHLLPIELTIAIVFGILQLLIGSIQLWRHYSLGHSVSKTPQTP